MGNHRPEGAEILWSSRFMCRGQRTNAVRCAHGECFVWIRAVGSKSRRHRAMQSFALACGDNIVLMLINLITGRGHMQVSAAITFAF